MALHESSQALYLQFSVVLEKKQVVGPARWLGARGEREGGAHKAEGENQLSSDHNTHTIDRSPSAYAHTCTH